MKAMKARYHNGDAGNYIGQHLFGDDNQAMEIPNVILEVDEFDDVIEVAPNILDGLYVRISSGALESKCGNFIVGQKAAEMEFADEFTKGTQKWSSRNTIIQLLTAAAVDAVQCGEFEVGPDGVVNAYYKLSTGLPVNEAKDSKRKEAFKNKLESYTHLVQFFHAPEPFAGKTVKIHYQRVLVNSEGNAAHVDLSRDDDDLRKRADRPFTDETYLLNDIGGGTYDIGVIREGRRIDSEASRSYELGLSPEIDKIIEEVADKFQYRFPSRHAFTICATKKDYRILLRGTEEVNIREIATKYLKPLAHEVLKKLDSTWNRVPEAVTAVFIGGGSLLLRPYLEELNGGKRNLWFCESAEESRWAIARAYAKLNRIYDLMHTVSK